MDNAIYGSAKAWVNFYGISTTTINASYNVSSVTRNGTGDYTINYTNGLADTKYAVCGFSVGYSSTNIQGASMVTYVASSAGSEVPILKSTTQSRIQTGNVSNGNLFDSGDVSFIVFR